MRYKNIDTNEVFTLEELKLDYEVFRWDMEDPKRFGSFDEYLDTLLDLGRIGIGGLVEVE